jgi:hypothetical protein
MHITRNTTNRIFAIPADAAAIPPNPRTAAISAIIRKVTAHPNIYITSSAAKSHSPADLRVFYIPILEPKSSDSDRLPLRCRGGYPFPPQSGVR